MTSAYIWLLIIYCLEIVRCYAPLGACTFWRVSYILAAVDGRLSDPKTWSLLAAGCLISTLLGPLLLVGSGTFAEAGCLILFAYGGTGFKCK